MKNNDEMEERFFKFQAMKEKMSFLELFLLESEDIFSSLTELRESLKRKDLNGAIADLDYLSFVLTEIQAHAEEKKLTAIICTPSLS